MAWWPTAKTWAACLIVYAYVTAKVAEKQKLSNYFQGTTGTEHKKEPFF